MVFEAVDCSLEKGRTQVARIVGRDTSGLSAQEVRTAALETLAENLSDGVVAPLFWYLLLGVPGMMAYKILMVLASGRLSLLTFVKRFGREHASPNSGYPEAALAGILDCRFGGPHRYFGQLFVKPYIGENERLLSTADMLTGITVNRRTEVMMIVLVVWLRALCLM